MGICGNCRYRYVEVIKGMLGRNYCNNPCSENYMGNVYYYSGCSRCEEVKPRYKAPPADIKKGER